MDIDDTTCTTETRLASAEAQIARALAFIDAEEMADLWGVGRVDADDLRVILRERD
jgi:hypothetical protein